ncbi:ADP-ribosyltransferase [Acerihabitans arboris]|uniref:NAD(+)--protein-arginine ADP-ribosyltransferase n=1 Tax=Acerihabitans arboris TaxID=2691583 RepID=A0A845SMM8_9GAMM|nr:ADP-ribosyltransferase [Acerihabitans arboris]NDL64652.1 hypothetical protein [Acerihabitans arboris]
MPNPVTPFISLGINLEKMSSGDNAAERDQGMSGAINDGVNILLMALTDVLEKLASPPSGGFRPGPAVGGGKSITSRIRKRLSLRRRLSAVDGVKQGFGVKMPVRRKFVPYRERIKIHPEIINFIKEAGIAGLSSVPGARINGQGIVLSSAGKRYLKIKGKFHQVIQDAGIGRYRLCADMDMALFYDDDYQLYVLSKEKKASVASEPVVYEDAHCRKKRNPMPADPGCVKFSQDLAGLLRRSGAGIDARDIKSELLRDTDQAFVYRDSLNAKTYINFEDKYYLVKANSNKKGYGIYAQRKTGFRAIFSKNPKKLINVFYSAEKGKLYQLSKTGYVQESLDLSAAGAKLYVFCTEKINEGILSSGEISALIAYGGTNYDAVNDFLRQGSPPVFISPWVREVVASQAGLLEQALMKIPAYPGMVYRGGIMRKKALRAIHVNDVLISTSFISTSVEKTVAQRFAFSSVARFSPVLFDIYLEKSGYPIMLYTRHLEECEVLIQRNAFFIVKKRGDGVISLRELPPKNALSLLKKHPEAQSFDFYGNKVHFPVRAP